jgi:hypothetical protein
VCNKTEEDERAGDRDGWRGGGMGGIRRRKKIRRHKA